MNFLDNAFYHQKKVSLFTYVNIINIILLIIEGGNTLEKGVIYDIHLILVSI